MISVPAHMRERAARRLEDCRCGQGNKLQCPYCETPKTALQGDRTDSRSSSQWQTTCNNTCTGSVHPNIILTGQVQDGNNNCPSYVFMVWGGVSQHHRTELVVIAGNLNAVRFREDIVLPHVVPFLQAHPDMTLQHDNATSHTVRDFLQYRNVSVLP